MKTWAKHKPNELVKLLDITNAINQSLEFSILSSQNFSTEWYLKSLYIRSFIKNAKTIANIEITNASVSYVRGNFSYDFSGMSSYRISKITGYPS